MDGVRNMFSLLWLDTDDCHGDGLWTTSLVSTRSVCALSRSVMLGVLRSSDQIPTNALEVSCSASNVLTDTWRNLAGTTLLRNRLPVRTFVSLGIDHCIVLTVRHRNIQSPGMFFPHPLLETSTFSGVSLKTLLVLTHRRILRPSHSAAWRISGFSEPHHCVPQWLTSIFLISSLRPATAREQQSVGGRFGQPQQCSALSHVLECRFGVREMYRPIALDFGRSNSSVMLIAATLFTDCIHQQLRHLSLL